MFVTKSKKYVFANLSCLLLSLLLILAGCDATSDPKVYYQTTGSWEGTIGADRVRGIIAPDGSYHLAIVDVNGDFSPGAGEYIGKLSFTDRENNVGSLTMVFLHPPDNAGDEQQVTFKLESNSLFSGEAPINLSRTSDISPGLYAQDAVAGRWSLTFSDTDKFTAANVDAAGQLSGNDGVACQYSGTVNLLDPAWNIFQLDLTFTDLPGQDCSADVSPNIYRGLAMTLPAENNRRRLWLAANSWEISRNATGTFFGNWAETVNVAPVARMTANAIELQASVVQPLNVKKLTGLVKLSTQGSSDENKDPLTYQWSGTAPNGAALNILATPEGTATFTPAMEGVFTLRLTANDGLLDSVQVVRQINVAWVADRFVDCRNGTVLDTTTDLFWLKNAGCEDLHAPLTNWWVNLDTAIANVYNLAAGGCSLTDGSVATNWRLPLLAEFETIIEKNTYVTAPALVNGVGDVQWQDGDIFTNVGINPSQQGNPWLYWTSETSDIPFGLGYVVDFGYQAPAPWSISMSMTNLNAVWPVRDAISAVAEDEVDACLQAAP